MSPSTPTAAYAASDGGNGGDGSNAPGNHCGGVRLTIPVDAAVEDRIQALVSAHGLALASREATAETVTWILVAAAHPGPATQLAIACFLHWSLADVEDRVTELFDPLTTAWVSLEELIPIPSDQPRAVAVIDEAAFTAALGTPTTQIIECRAIEDFLGLDVDRPETAHIDGTTCVPLVSVLEDHEEERFGDFIATEALLGLFDVAGIDFLATAVVIGASALDAAAVATALMLAGHGAVSFTTAQLTCDLVASLPEESRSSAFIPSPLLLATESGAFDVSPDVRDGGSSSEDRSELNKEYDEYVKDPSKENDPSDDSDAEVDAEMARAEESVWISESGHRYFDMPHPISKELFLGTSQDIYRVVSFVLAPFGFPHVVLERFSVSEVKTRCSALFQDAIEVCSDLVYHQRDLNEGAMAMSVHKWVEKKRDPACTEQVRRINDLLETLYQPPVFVEVPDMSDERILEVADELHSRLTAAIRKRAPWAFEVDDTDVNSASAPTPEVNWKDVVYPSVVYALGFQPPASTTAKKRMSTLQIKSFIQTVAETVWEVVGDEHLSQVQFQALCDAVTGDKRQVLEAIKETAEQALYVLKHSLTQSLEREEELVASLAAVRSAAEDGERAVRSGRYEAALATFSRALSLVPIFHKEVAPLLVGRAKCFIKLGETERARQEVELLLKLDPFSCGAYSCLGAIDEAAGEPEAAMQHYVTAFILDGSRSPDHAGDIDRVARHVGRNVAKDIFKTMVLQHELPTQWLVESYFDSFEHDVDNGLRVPYDIEKIVGRPAVELSPETLVQRAIHHKRRREYRAAQADITAALDRGIGQIEVPPATEPSALGEDEEQGTEAAATTAEATATAIEQQRTLAAAAWNLHASFLYVAGDVHAALEAISGALTLAPTSVNALIKKGGFLSEIGEMDEATECFDRAAELDPNAPDVYLHMGQKELLEGQFQEAVQCLRRAMSRSEALPVTHVSYGMALYKSGSIYQALDVFADAARAFPESPEVHLFYGEVLADQGDYAQAMSHFHRALTLSPRCPLPFLNAGRIYVGTNDPLRAIAHFEQALAIDDRCSSAHLDIAQVLFAQGRVPEAMTHFARAATCCRFLPEVEEVCAAEAMARMQERVTDILGVDLRHIMRTK